MSQRQLAFILCICINIAKLSCVPAQTCKSIDNVNANNNYILPAYAIASLASQLPNSTLCEKELQSFRDAVDERIFWSLKVLDSSGTFQSGFLFGNNFWLGSRIQCVDAMNNIPLQISQRHSLNKTLYHNSQMEIPPFSDSCSPHIIKIVFLYADNKVWTSKVTSNFIFQIVTNASLSVDTFFFLSGFLMSYFYLKDKMDKNRMQPLTFRAKLNEFLIMVIRRFIRLTPAYVMTLLISQLSSTWLDKISPFYLYERPHENCPKYWWKNLLYINNFSPIKNMCMSWSWYLSADMQFFIIGLALLILSTTYFVIAVVILVSLLIGSIIFTGYLSYIYEFIPTFDEQQRLADVLYFPSWVRISPYIIGIIIGYISIRLNGKFVLKRRTVILCWCLGSACNLSMLFGIYKRQVPILYSTFYIAFHRGIWAIGIAWIVIACLTQHGGIINDILSFKGWVPFSRLSYCAYLINPFIIHFFHLQTERSVHFELISMIVTSIGFLGIIYFCSYILSLLAETPYSLLLRKIMQTRNRLKYKWRNSEKL
ncbi:nose resistant to fluoxetine protein 6-like [Pogonomyrmex barbatus]|uniref:Nose resistant to fluoxetine protein 6-like n=1 Tax=Pogonomyrmex barbatus TaxID=144034 RepID=A0A6I9VV34_9HYME|nr:nose resistant to fluoxetine protein 6-like [Pogonomyrmex barbatus]